MKSVSSDDPVGRESGLARGLTSRQLTMIGIGGAIGTGLFMGSGLAISYAGPGVLLSYAFAALIALSVMFSLAEMAVVNPTAGSFGSYAELYVSPLAGWLARWTYWAEMVILIGSEAVAVGHYLTFWAPDLPLWLSTLVSGGLILFVNTRAVGDFGTVEYWLSTVKVLAILAFVILGLAMISGINGPAVGFSNYLADGGPLPFGLSGIWMGSMIAIFSFFGIEMVAVAAGEARDPGTTVPRAMRTLLVRLCLFYLLSIAIILAIVPWSDSGAEVVEQSPFVKVFAGFGIPGAAGAMNFVVLCAALSAMNSSLFMASRMLFSLARAGQAPRIFGKLSTYAVPAHATLASGVGILIAAGVALLTPRAFEYLVGLALFGGLFTWSLILFTHYCFRRRVDTRSLSYRARGFPLLQLCGSAGLLTILATMAWSGGVWRSAVAIGFPWLAATACAFVIWRNWPRARLADDRPHPAPPRPQANERANMTHSAHIDRFVADRLPPEELQPDFVFDRPALRYPERLNAAVELVDTIAPSRIAIVNAAGRWTYGDIRTLSNRIARLLTEQEDFVPGNRVLLRGPNCAMQMAAWLGILKAGGVVVATMPMLRAGEIAKILERAAVSHAIIDGRTAADFDIAAATTSGLRSILRYDGDSGGGEMETRLRSLPPDFIAVPTHRDDPALIAFTSGTTGIPKGCVQFHRDILACADSFAASILQPRPDDVWICSAPIAFTFGLGMQMIFPWRFGGTAATIETPGPKALLDAAIRFGVTVMATAPTAYRAMIDLLAETPLPTSLRQCVSAGEDLPLPVWQAWREATGLELVNGIGSTEMMHIFISAAGGDIRPGTTGRPVPGYQAILLDEAGHAIGQGTGRLAVKGPTGCRYLDDPRQAEYVLGGWNITGDIYSRSKDGYFTYVARHDDMIVSSGYNIAAPEVENALLLHEAVAECAVTGIPCGRRGQQVAALIVVRPGIPVRDGLVEELQAHVRAAIAPYKYPRIIRFVPALPRTPNGKVQRSRLRRTLAGQD